MSNYSPGKKILFTLIAVLLPVIIIFLIGEAYFRINPVAVLDPEPPPPWNYRVLDEEVGWINKPNYYYEGNMTDAKGDQYPVRVSFDENGFRSHQPNSFNGAPVIFFIGDSYTQSIEVSDEKTFYHLIGDSLQANIYAYGAAGYGTTQEFLILKKYFDLIKPDLVVLQMCTNDFSDNNCLLEKKTNYKVGQRRPYMNEDGEVSYDRAWMRHKHLRKYSYFLYYLTMKMDRLKERAAGESNRYEGERKITEMDTLYPPFNNSFYATGYILAEIKTCLKDRAQLIAFVSDHYDPAAIRLEELCHRNNILTVPDVGKKVHEHHSNGETVRSSDNFHWNERGHEIVSKEIGGYLRQYPNLIGDREIIQ